MPTERKKAPTVARDCHTEQRLIGLFCLSADPAPPFSSSATLSFPFRLSMSDFDSDSGDDSLNHSDASVSDGSSSNYSTDSESGPLRVLGDQARHLRPLDASPLSLAQWWYGRKTPSRHSLLFAIPEPAPPQPPLLPDVKALLFDVFCARHLRANDDGQPSATIRAIAVRQTLSAHQWKQRAAALIRQQQQSAATVSTSSSAASATLQASSSIAQAPSVAGRKRPLESLDEEGKASATSSAAPTASSSSESMLDAAPSLSSASSTVVAAADSTSSSIAVPSIAQPIGSYKKPRNDGASSPTTTAVSAASNAPRRFSAPAISVSLVLQFLQLDEVAAAMCVSRQWCAAALDPLVYSDRSSLVYMHRLLGRHPIRVQPVPLNAKDATMNGLEGLEGSYRWKEFECALSQFTSSRLFRMQSALDIADSESMSASQLAELRAALPKLTGLRGELRRRTSSAGWTIALAPNLRTLELDVSDYALPRRIRDDDAWPVIVHTVARHAHLQRLVLSAEWCQFSPADVSLLLQSVPQLLSLKIHSRWCSHGLVFLSVVPLQSLTVGLTVLQVERLCENASMLPNLTTLELSIAYEDRDTDARDRAAARFKLTSDSPLLTPHRLSHLSRLPALLHLTLQLPSCAIDPLLPIRVAQQSDASAFQQLQSYTCIGELANPWNCMEVCPVGSPGAEQTISSPVMTAPLRPLRVLRFLHLSCCHSELLREDNRLAALCAAIPNVQTCTLQCHASPNALSLSWCRSPALHSLRKLSTLIVQQPKATKEGITAAMLIDLHALSRLPEIITFELVDVCRLNRLDLAELLTLRDPDVSSAETRPKS